MSLTKVSYSMITGSPVNIMDFIPAGIDTATTDCSAYIQAALDSKASNAVIYGGGRTYRCNSGIVIKGGYKTLDMGNGVLNFVSATALYGVTIRPTTLTAAGQEFKNGIINAQLEFFNATAVSGNIGIYQVGKSINNFVENVVISNVSGYGCYSEGGLDETSAFNSPDKGTHQNVTCINCTVSFYWVADTSAKIMSGHSIINCYSSTSNTGFYIKGCAEFSLVGVNAESYTNYGLRIDDGGYGGGHVMSGGFLEGAGTSFAYENPNPVNSNIILAKGSKGSATGPLLLTNSPAASLGFGGGIVITQAAFPVWDFNTTSPQLLSTNYAGCIATVMGRGGLYGRIYFGNDYSSRVTAGPFTNGTVYVITVLGNTNWATVGLTGTAAVGSMFTGNGSSSGTTGIAAPMFTQIIDQSLSLFSITAGTASKVNVYPATVGGVTGMYLQNNSTTGAGFGTTVVGGVSILNMS